MTSVGTNLQEFLAAPEKYAELNLSGQNVDDKQCQLLAKVLQDIDNIIQINLSNNSITDIGARALADMLVSNISIATLDLSRNYISDYCIVDLNHLFSSWRVMILYSQQEIEISEESIKFNQLLDIIAKRFDNKVYEELGDMFLQSYDIYRAFKCYKAIKNNDKIDACYEALIPYETNNLTLLEQIGDYWLSVGLKEKATLIYNKIIQSTSPQFQAPIWDNTAYTISDAHSANIKQVQLQGESFVKDLLNDYENSTSHYWCLVLLVLSN
jgi:tetratricopeptide (TPR) repeat protein